jgi:hypothetical protein
VRAEINRLSDITAILTLERAIKLASASRKTITNGDSPSARQEQKVTRLGLEWIFGSRYPSTMSNDVARD